MIEKTAGRITRGLFFTAAAVIVVLLATCRLQNLRILSVESDSMAPVFHRGDALLVAENPPASKLAAGSVVTYISPLDNRTLISHRIVSIQASRGMLTTKGDAANKADIPVPMARLSGHATAVLPGIGRVLAVLRNPLGLVALVIVPGFLFCTSEILLLSQHLGRRRGKAVYTVSI